MTCDKNDYTTLKQEMTQPSHTRNEVWVTNNKNQAQLVIRWKLSYYSESDNTL